MRISKFLTTLALPLVAVVAANAQTGSTTPQRDDPSRTLQEDAERGWFFYEREPEPQEPEEPLELPPAQLPQSEPPREERCSKRETWTSDCGFVDPGPDFEFQAKQRDALLQSMSMSRNDPQAVENFQYYMKWLMERSIEVANLWQYNLVQNPELDASVTSPINSFGLRLMTDVRDSSAGSILQALKEEGAFLVYFSRYDCTFCHAMSSPLKLLEDNTGLEVWNTALDGHCMPGFEARCRTGETAVTVAQALQVSIVPTLFLYVPGATSESDTWIRIATGVTDMTTMKGRVVAFFTAYRTALLKGVANGAPGRAPVDFSEVDPTGIAQGTPIESPSGAAVRLPTEEEILDLLGQ